MKAIWDDIHYGYEKKDSRRHQEYYAEARLAVDLMIPREVVEKARTCHIALFGGDQDAAQEATEVLVEAKAHVAGCTNLVVKELSVILNTWRNSDEEVGYRAFLSFRFYAKRPSEIPCEEDCWEALGRFYVTPGVFEERRQHVAQWLIDQSFRRYAASMRKIETALELRLATGVAKTLSSEAIKAALKVVRYKQRQAALNAEFEAEVEAQVELLLAQGEKGEIEFTDTEAVIVQIGLKNLQRFAKAKAARHGGPLRGSINLEATLDGKAPSDA